jgi:hypothetical protein
MIGVLAQVILIHSMDVKPPLTGSLQAEKSSANRVLNPALLETQPSASMLKRKTTPKMANVDGHTTSGEKHIERKAKVDPVGTMGLPMHDIH